MKMNPIYKDLPTLYIRATVQRWRTIAGFVFCDLRMLLCPLLLLPPPACHAPLIIDIAGTALTDIDRQRLAHPLVGGMILFGRNWHDRAQLTALCAQIKALRPDLLICVDHEGGRVQRFRTDGFTHLPAMGVLGQLWTQASPRTRPARQRWPAATCWPAELRACGVDLSFTPVLDLDWGEQRVIGDRGFDRDPAHRHQPGAKPDARPAAGGHGQLRQAFSGARLCRRPTRTWMCRWISAALQAILADDAAPYPVAGAGAHQRDARAHRLPAGGQPPRWLLAPLAARHPARPAGL